MKINWHKFFTFDASSDASEHLITQADAKNSEAQNNLGVLLSSSSTDYEAAAHCFRKAAEKGYALAQTNLAQMYAQGRGLPKDQREALNWLRRAARQGDAGAQFQLGRALHRQSLDSTVAGLSENRIEGFMWLQLASDQGFHNAESACNQLNLHMTKEEIEEGQSRVRHFVPALEKSSG
jgi:uncharacterized protein